MNYLFKSLSACLLLLGLFISTNVYALEPELPEPYRATNKMNIAVTKNDSCIVTNE